MGLSDIRSVACHYIKMAAYTMWHNYSGSPEDLQAENAGLAGAIQVMKLKHLSEFCMKRSICCYIAFIRHHGSSSFCTNRVLGAAVGVGA